MKADHFLNPASSFQVGSVGSLKYAVLSTPLALSNPAGLSTDPTELETLLRRWTGFHPSSAIFLIAWAANFGVATLKTMSAPDALRLMIWESTVASVVS